MDRGIDEDDWRFRVPIGDCPGIGRVRAIDWLYDHQPPSGDRLGPISAMHQPVQAAFNRFDGEDGDVWESFEGAFDDVSKAGADDREDRGGRLVLQSVVEPPLGFPHRLPCAVQEDRFAS